MRLRQQQQGWADTCLEQKWLQTGSGSCGCWYSDNNITSSNEGYSPLWYADAYFCYCNGYSYRRTQWAPAGDIYNTSPNTVTQTVSFSSPWGGYSVSETQGANSVTFPYFPNDPTNAGFGAEWSGDSPIADVIVSASSNAIVNPGVGSPGAAHVHGDIQTSAGLYSES